MGTQVAAVMGGIVSNVFTLIPWQQWTVHYLGDDRAGQISDKGLFVLEPVNNPLSPSRLFSSPILKVHPLCCPPAQMLFPGHLQQWKDRLCCGLLPSFAGRYAGTRDLPAPV